MNSYNNLIIFDLDGVMIDSKKAHFDALNKALKASSYLGISENDQPKFEAMPTRVKIEKLGITGVDAVKIREDKAKFFLEDYVDSINENPELLDAIVKLKGEGYKLAVASNAVRSTVWTILSYLGVFHLFDYVVSNEDVKNPKPAPEMYWKCMNELNAIPDTTLILEDSQLGLDGAYDSGAMVEEVDGPKDLVEFLSDLDYIKLKFEPIYKREVINPEIQAYYSPEVEEELWKAFGIVLPEAYGSSVGWSLGKTMDDMLLNALMGEEPEEKPVRNIVIPMAGAGSRFKAAGFELPKPLIEVNGKPMIAWVLDNLACVEGRRIFIVQEEHIDEFGLDKTLEDLSPGCEIVTVKGVTGGAVLSVLAAEAYINSDIPLMIINSDQYLDIGDYLSQIVANLEFRSDGGILCFETKDGDPRWSYADVDWWSGAITEVAEKKPISNYATTGIYVFKKGSDFVDNAYEMIGKGIKHNGEYYIAPVFNQGIQKGNKYVIDLIDKTLFHGLGDPQSLVNFLNKELKEYGNS